MSIKKAHIFLSSFQCFKNLLGFKKNIPSFLILNHAFGLTGSSFLIGIITSFLILNSSFLISQTLDQQTYNYTSGTNQLSSVSDLVIDVTSAIDIDNQASTNYAYDAKGQLTKDEAEGILSITWTAAGKVKEVTYADRTLHFKYDALGNRIKKTETFLTTGAPQLTTYYVCNATGAVMSIYQNDGSGIKRTEVPIGTGIDKTEEPTTAATEVFQPKKGNKYYQLNDHLGSARTVISDTKQSTLTGSTYAPGNYTASIASANDYYSFGMQMPGRSLSSVEGYRYGFQGKEKDDELKGNGNSYDFGARIYDARLGRWNSLDPLASQFPNKSPYNMCSNNPINRVDPTGMADTVTGPKWCNNMVCKYLNEKAFELAFSTDLPKKLVNNYAYANGKTLPLTYNEMADLRVVNDKGGDVDLVPTLKNNMTIPKGQGQWAVVINPFVYSALAQHEGTLAHMDIIFSGVLYLTSNNRDGKIDDWRFDGKMAYSDKWDFDKKKDNSIRGEECENQSSFARNWLVGMPLPVYGEVEINLDKKHQDIDFFRGKDAGPILSKRALPNDPYWSVRNAIADKLPGSYVAFDVFEKIIDKK